MAVRPASLLHDRASAAPAGRVLSSRSTWFLRGRADWQPRHRGRPFLCGTPVLLVDFSSDALPYLVKYDPVTPGFRTAKEWLQSVTGDRLAPPKKGMRIRHRPKRATNAQLAEQLGSLLTGLPSGPRGASSQGAGSVDCSASGSEGRSTRRENSRRRTDRGWEPPRRCRGVGRRGLDLRQPRRALRPLGGFGSQKSLGIVFWLLSNIADCGRRGQHGRAHGVEPSSRRAMCSGRRFVGGRSFNYPPRRLPASALSTSPGQCQSKATCLWWTDSTDMGNYDVIVHSRNRSHPEPENGSCK